MKNLIDIKHIYVILFFLIFLYACDVGEEYTIIRDPVYSSEIMNEEEIFSHRKNLGSRKLKLGGIIETVDTGDNIRKITDIFGDYDIKHTIYKTMENKNGAITYSVYFSFFEKPKSRSDMSKSGIAFYYDENENILMVKSNGMKNNITIGNIPEERRYMLYN